MSYVFFLFALFIIIHARRDFLFMMSKYKNKIFYPPFLGLSFFASKIVPKFTKSWVLLKKCQIRVFNVHYNIFIDRNDHPESSIRPDNGGHHSIKPSQSQSTNEQYRPPDATNREQCGPNFHLQIRTMEICAQHKRPVRCPVPECSQYQLPASVVNR